MDAIGRSGTGLIGCHGHDSTQCNDSDFGPRPLPIFARPQLEISGNKTTLEYLRCCSFETVIGQQFHLVEEDIVYRIHSIHVSPDGYMFSIQYDIRKYH